MTGFMTMRATNRKTDVDARKISIDALAAERKLGIDAEAAIRKLRADEVETTYRREEAINQRYDGMLARLERMVEQQNKKIDEQNSAMREAEERAAKDRREMRGVMDEQTGQIGKLRRRVEQLIRVFREQTGMEPPPPED